MTIRQRLIVAVVVISGLMLVLIVLGFNVALRSSLRSDANSLLDARAQAALETVTVGQGKVSVGEAPDDGAPDSLVWVFSGDKAIESPQVGPGLDALAGSLAQGSGGMLEDPATDVRLNGLPVRSNGRQVGMVVSGISLEPYETTASRAAIASVALALAMLVLIALATRVALDRALRPVARMTAEASDWSEHDLDRRFNEGEPKDELTRLASTFDSMLDRMAAMLRHERNFSAEVSHELRTPLAAIAAEAELALSRDRASDEYREALARIVGKSSELGRILETLLEVARTEAGTGGTESCDLRPVVLSLVTSESDRADAFGVEVIPPREKSELRAQLAPETLARILSPLLDNALAFARSEVTFEFGRNGRAVSVGVLDDGPGVAPGEVEAIFEPGSSGSAPRNPAAPTATGLGLALSRRLARAAGGEVEFRSGDSGHGFFVTLPTALDRDG
jgi:signal transduction histidine kinase